MLSDHFWGVNSYFCANVLMSGQFRTLAMFSAQYTIQPVYFLNTLLSTGPQNLFLTYKVTHTYKNSWAMGGVSDLGALKILALPRFARPPTPILAQLVTF